MRDRLFEDLLSHNSLKKIWQFKILVKSEFITNCAQIQKNSAAHARSPYSSSLSSNSCPSALSSKNKKQSNSCPSCGVDLKANRTTDIHFKRAQNFFFPVKFSMRMSLHGSLSILIDNCHENSQCDTLVTKVS